jgi:MFS transporter, putative metabolite:H+ symporter
LARHDHPVFDQRQRRLLLLLAIACYTEGYDFNALMVALPHLRHEFGLSRAAADLWVAAVYLGAAPALWLGRRADRHGRRGVLVLAVAGYTVCSAATALAPDMAVFVVTQFFARTFLAVQVAVAWTVAAEELPAERRGFGFGILALASALGTGQGAILEAAVLAPLHASWRWIYVASLPVVVVILVLRRSLPESRRYENLVASGRMHGRAAVLLSPAYRNRLFLICGTVLLANLTTQATVFAIDYMQTQRHLGTSTANLVLVGAGLICLPVLTGAGQLSDRFGRRPVCATAMLIQAVGVVLFFNVATTAPMLLAMLAVTYIGVFGAWTTGSAFGVEAFPTALRATAGSAVTMAKLAGQCASFIGSAVLIRSIGHSGLVVGLLAIGPLVAALLVARVFPETSGQELADTAAAHLVPAELVIVAGS